MKSDLYEWSYNNWLNVPEDTRKACVASLREFIPQSIINEWQFNLKHKNIYPGQEIEMFHFLGGGMQLRNRLREVLKDDDLPGVVYEYQAMQAAMHNWDDYYLGALLELVNGTE